MLMRFLISSFCSDVSLSLAALVERVDIIVDQTKPRKKEVKKQAASRMLSEVRESLFSCIEMPYEAERKNFHHLSEENETRLLTEVKRYVTKMRDNFLQGKVDEVIFVQPEIRDFFLPNICSCLNFSYDMKSEKEYTLNADNEVMEAVISGKTDHVIQFAHCGCASATLKDKANCKRITSGDVAQAATQVIFEVKQMETFLNYVPQEFVGLLQNGPEWVAIIRRVVNGKVLLIHTCASPAFEASVVDKHATVSDVNEDSCLQIARLIGHAFCTADTITGHLLDPTTRPNMMGMHAIKEHESDDEDDAESGEDSDHKHDGDSGGGAHDGAGDKGLPKPPGKQPATERNGKQQGQQKKASLNRDATSENSDYFVLPLSLSNVALQPESRWIF
jgi:hypothetical protein